MIESVDELVEVLGRAVAHDDSESLDLLAHGLQSADILAAQEPADLELQVAGLVHDLGTVLEPGRPASHAETGAAAIEPLLGPRVANLVRQHDDAKRYLVTAEPDYRAVLSPQSIVTLAEQGGLMDERERHAFESDHDFAAMVTLRRADDAAKVPDRAVPGLATWRERLGTLTQLRG